MQASDGLLYGTTAAGGSKNAGVIFSFDPSSRKYVKLKTFGISENGIRPSASLLYANDKKLYGVTLLGGINDLGVIYSFDPSTSKYAKLADFDGKNGANPYGSLIQAKDGKLYGMTSKGGKSDVGVIFSFDPSTLVYTKLKDFDKTNGANPYGSLLQAVDGKLYGMTSGGGTSNNGVIFSVDPASLKYIKLKDFNDGGKNPYGSLMQASDGKLYGMTLGGGSELGGVIFSFDPSSSTYKKLKDFDGKNGSGPYGSLMQASDGKLYGLTYGGGAEDTGYPYGVIFSFDPSSSVYGKLKTFDKDDGVRPYGNLMQASDGKLYGITSDGGSLYYKRGAIFSFEPAFSIFAKLQDFDNGGDATFGAAFIDYTTLFRSNKRICQPSCSNPYASC